jgi:hypothetical protein
MASTESATEPPVAVVDLLTSTKAGTLTMLRSDIGIAPTDIIGSAAINVIGSPFGDIIGPLTPKNRPACRGDLLSGDCIPAPLCSATAAGAMMA